MIDDNEELFFKIDLDCVILYSVHRCMFCFSQLSEKPKVSARWSVIKQKFVNLLVELLIINTMRVARTYETCF